MVQYELFSKTMPEQFESWVHTNNGREVSNKFIRLAYGLMQRGFKTYSSKAIVERLRWHYDLKNGPDSEGFKVNNNYTAGLARFAMEREPRLKGFFKLREQGKQVAGRKAVVVVIN